MGLEICLLALAIILAYIAKSCEIKSLKYEIDNLKDDLRELKLKVKDDSPEEK